MSEMKGRTGRSSKTDARPAEIPLSSLLPRGEEEQRVMEGRAARLAQVEVESRSAEMTPYVCFRLGADELYGIPYRHAEEVICSRGLTKAPCAPPFIAGVINRRGELLTVMNLKHFFHTEECPESEDAEEQGIIVVSGGGLTVGVLADEVRGNDEYDPAGLEAPLPSDGVSDIRHVRGIHRGRVTILDVEVLLGDPALIVNNRQG